MDRDTTEVDVAIGHENASHSEERWTKKAAQWNPSVTSRKTDEQKHCKTENRKTISINLSKQKNPKNQVVRSCERPAKMERNQKKCNTPRSQIFSNTNDEYHRRPCTSKQPTQQMKQHFEKDTIGIQRPSCISREYYEAFFVETPSA